MDEAADGDERFTTMEFIAEARRPLLIERHRKLIEEMESCLSDLHVTGDPDNQRLVAMHAQLEYESERARIAELMKTLASDSHYKEATLRGALVDELCLLREQKGVEVATLQLHVIGVYRTVRNLITPHQAEAPSLADLRELPATFLGRMINPIAPQFGTPGLAESLVFTPAFADRCMRSIKRMRRADKGAAIWEEANGEPALPREDELPLEKLPDEERREARRLLVANRIRSQFYKDVFLQVPLARRARSQGDRAPPHHPALAGGDRVHCPPLPLHAGPDQRAEGLPPRPAHRQAHPDP